MISIVNGAGARETVWVAPEGEMFECPGCEVEDGEMEETQVFTDDGYEFRVTCWECGWSMRGRYESE